MFSWCEFSSFLLSTYSFSEVQFLVLADRFWVGNKMFRSMQCEIVGQNFNCSCLVIDLVSHWEKKHKNVVNILVWVEESKAFH